jgi:hypothetical protein
MGLHVALTWCLVAVVGLATASSAEDPDAIAGATSAEPEFVAPWPLTPTAIAFPDDAPGLEEPVRVSVKLRVDEAGQVQEVTLIESATVVAGEAAVAFDLAVLTGVTAFRFLPARFQGRPVPVDITFAQQFLPPAPVSQEPLAVLSGVIIEKGTRHPIPGAQVVIHEDTTERQTQAGSDGRFWLRATAGEHDVEVRAAGYKRFVVHERLEAGTNVEVRYLAERLSYDPYETLVVGQLERSEVARTTLRDRELKQVPGTFGDPFRVVTALPGVGQMMSLLAYPIVRGTSPGSTGFLLDGVPVPQLFHLLGGPAVVHPEFIDRVDFYPGTFPVQFGGYTGGIVDGVSRPPRPDDRRLDVMADLVRAGAFVQRPLPKDGSVTLAGTYGYPGALLSLLQADAFLSYWDYQLRLDAGRSNRFSAFVFGSYDEAGTRIDGKKVTSARSQFHRLDLRYRNGDADAFLLYEVVLGLDHVLSRPEVEGESAATLRTLSINPRLTYERAITPKTRLRTGAEWSVHMFRGTPQAGPTGEPFTLDSRLYAAGLFIDAPSWVTPNLLVTPGARADLYANSEVTQWALDPRVSWRYHLFESQRGITWLKGGAGYYHQPPRFFIPVPGFEDFALSRGLLATVQTSLGVEQPLADEVEADVQTYFHYMDPILFDLALNQTEVVPLDDEGNPTEPIHTPYFDRRVGRAYGVEVLLRKRGSGNLFGWVSYTLSRSERRYEGRWVAFDFDRTHMLNVVLGTRLPRNWEVGGRIQFQTGRPVTSETLGYNGTRLSPFYRFDMRIDKRAVWNDFMLDFYVEVLNVSLAAEELDAQTPPVPFILPFIGVRAVL